MFRKRLGQKRTHLEGDLSIQEKMTSVGLAITYLVFQPKHYSTQTIIHERSGNRNDWKPFCNHVKTTAFFVFNLLRWPSF